VAQLAASASYGDDAPSGEFWNAVAELRLPFYLIDPSTFTVVNATGDLLAFVNRSLENVLGRKVFDLFVGEEHQSIEVSLSTLAKGGIDFYRSRRMLANSSGPPREVVVWVKAIDFGSRRYALAEVCDRFGADESPLVQYLGFTPQKIAVGMTDEKGVVTLVSNDIESVIGIPAERLIGHRLLNDDDQRRWDMVHSSPPAKGGCSISLILEHSNAKGASLRTRCILTCFADSSVRCFILIPEPKTTSEDANQRIAELEQRLLRIAAEIQASGVFDTVSSFPDLTSFVQLGNLSAREWEVLSRLLRGERVPTIARALFVSQSTVRNNLSSIYRKFDVHSQDELLHLLLHSKNAAFK
jgi:DNA-binding CsgD family transcriptional regulator